MSDYSSRRKKDDGIEARANNNESSLSIGNLVFYACIGLGFNFLFQFLPQSWQISQIIKGNMLAEPSCPPPLPTILSTEPPPPDHEAINLATKSFDQALSRIFHAEDLDALAVSVITSGGSVYENFFGSIDRTKDPEQRRAIDRDSVFRIASISKVFACMEALILRDRGVLNLDDPISKYISELDFKEQQSTSVDPVKEVVTFRQLMSHMTGLIREHPSGESSKRWPEERGTGDPPTFITHPYHTTEDLIRGMSEHRLILTPNKLPSYSNAGFSVLGAALMAAVRSSEGVRAPKSYAQLIKRDIFDVLGLRNSSFLAGGSNKDHQVIPSVKSHETYLDFGIDNPTGGQMTTVADLITFSRNLLDPDSKLSLLSSSSAAEFFNPVYHFADGVTSVGIPWEVRRITLPNDRSVEEFYKAGSLSSQFSAFTVVPALSFAVVVLSAGKVNKAPDINRLAMDHFVPAFDKALIGATAKHLSGVWKQQVTGTELHIVVEGGALYATHYTVNGTDALVSLDAGEKIRRVPIWSVGNNEFKLRPVPRGSAGTDCYWSWLTLDEYAYVNGFAVNLIRLVPHKEGSEKNRLEIPSLKASLSR